MVSMKKYRAGRYQMRQYGKKPVEMRQIISVFALLLVLAGLGIVGYFLLGGDSLILRILENATSDDEPANVGPTDTTLYLTVPNMARVEDLPVYDTPWDDESALEKSAQHVQGTGFPWQEEANVYIAGHRMGWPGTRSFLVFYDLDTLENGDEVYLTDSDGTKYTYEVFNEFVADPFDWGPTESVPGKNIVTLQTCTLPDYVNRIIVQAELTEVTPGSGTPQEEEKGTPEASSPQEGVAAPGANVPQEGVAPGGVAPPQAVPPKEAVPPQAVPPKEAVPQGEATPKAVYPFLAFFAFRGRRSALRRLMGSPFFRCCSATLGTSHSSRPRYQTPSG
jgi:sortase A